MHKKWNKSLMTITGRELSARMRWCKIPSTLKTLRRISQTKMLKICSKIKAKNRKKLQSNFESRSTPEIQILKWIWQSKRQSRRRNRAQSGEL